jgi:hypothetical protein
MFLSELPHPKLQKKASPAELRLCCDFQLLGHEEAQIDNTERHSSLEQLKY